MYDTLPDNTYTVVTDKQLSLHLSIGLGGIEIFECNCVIDDNIITVCEWIWENPPSMHFYCFKKCQFETFTKS